MAFSAGWGGNWRSGARLLGGATLLLGLVETWRVQVREYDVALAHLPRGAEGVRILQISDWHYGLLMPRALMRRIVRLAAAQKADAIVLTGDMVSRRNSYLPGVRLLARPITAYAAILAAELRAVHPPQGMWAVPGNHDLWNGSFAPIADALDKAGVRTLVNQAVRLSGGLALLGLDDLRAGNPRLDAAFAGIDAGEAQVILSHNPRLALLLREREALVLSGHTHGGQIKLPFFRAKAPSDSEQTSWQSGFYAVGRAQLYVGAGAGQVGLPIRLGVPPEIAVFTLRRKLSS